MSRPEPFDLRDFVRESNRIEGIIRDPWPYEVAAHETFMLRPEVDVLTLVQFVDTVAHAELRDRPGMNVWVGNHFPTQGGPKVLGDLKVLLRAIAERRLTPLEAHRRYENLHPFMDGNGRSGRALWLHMMGGIERAPLGFLHHWYYQSLSGPEGRTP